VISGAVSDIPQKRPAKDCFCAVPLIALFYFQQRALPMKRTLLVCGLLAGWGIPAVADEPITFNKHVASILWKNCGTCHHPGAVGPFPLLTYKDAAKRAKFIQEITASRRMPPWKAAANFGVFHNERRLSETDLETIARWVKAGAPEGDPKDLPSRPTFPEGWQLGPPDLILKMPEPFRVPAGGPDVYRCFILPIPLDSDRTVAAVEFHPGNGRIVHHASFYLDDKGEARKKDRQDGRAGYTSFGGPGFAPSGGLGGWGLADLPRFLPEGSGMYVKKGSDLVLQLHYHPDGKEEQDQSELGVYFTRKPADKFVTSIFVQDRTLIIPAGEKRHHVSRMSEPLATDVQLLTVTPHMHNLGREIKVSAALPNGQVLPLVWITDWDFSWHEVYQYPRPLTLPKGTVIQFDAYFDNTADNPKNPNNPPKLVRYGNNLSDEMVGVNVQLLTQSMTDLRAVETMKNARFGPGGNKESPSKR
jgi:hypothetical protein